MPPPLYTQEGRSLEVSAPAPLDKDVLLLTTFKGREEMSRLFEYELEVLSKNLQIQAKDIVGKPVTWTVKPLLGRQRAFNGYVSQIAAGNLMTREGLRHYRLKVVPWLWFLTRTSDCRIFQKKTAPQIIEQIFSELGFTDYDLQLQVSYPVREYCVQYRETDFNFVSRLLEQHGIFYFFRHEKGKHTLVLADRKFAHKDCLEKDVEYFTGPAQAGILTRWEHRYEFRSGKWTQTDYNFETPSTSLEVSLSTMISLPNNKKYELRDYPAKGLIKDEVDAATRVRMEEEEVGHDVVHADGTASTFSPGFKFTLKKHPAKDEAGKAYVITAIEHSASEASYEIGADRGQAYRNTFSCIPEAVPFHPACTTPRPVVQGPQTAVVVGPKGEEIYTDKYGRVKVQFFWDREGKKDENSSCWVRVAENWAGKNWGIAFHPRIGQEVIVEFLEGDPDRPIITGRVYNAEQMPPYEVPKYQTRSAMKSRSSKGGGAENFNEIRFEDKKGGEQVFVNAERDLDLRVEHDGREFVGNDRHLIVKANQLEFVEKDKQAHVKGSHKEKVDKDLSQQVGQKRNEKVGTAYALEAGTEIHLKGKKIVLEASDQITLVCGGVFVDLSKAGVVIVGKPVKINSGGSAGSGSGSKPEDPKDPDVADDGSKGGKLS